jgi:hypothetical protein
MTLEQGQEQVERLVLVRIYVTDSRIREGVHPVAWQSHVIGPGG